MAISQLISEENNHDIKAIIAYCNDGNPPICKYRLWVFVGHGFWDVQYYSQEFESFSKKISIARNYDKWIIERCSDSVILAQGES